MPKRFLVAGIRAAAAVLLLGGLSSHGQDPSPGGLDLAYLDPGSGSFLVQIIIGILFGAMVTLKGCRKKVRNILTRSRAPTDRPPDEKDSR